MKSFVGPPPHSLLFWMVDEQNSRGGDREIEKTRTAQNRALEIDP